MTKTLRKTKFVTVHVTPPVRKKGKGSFYIGAPNASLKFGLREARTVYAALRDALVLPERRGKLL